MTDVRVWAEEREGNVILLTWGWPDELDSTRDREEDARTIAATVGVLAGVSSASPDEDGIAVIYDPDAISRQEIAGALRSALALEDDLKQRSNEMLRRLPKYASLAASIALDDRMSPAPEFARQTALRRSAGPMRVIPGFPLLAQIHAIIPMMRALSAWSRTSSPEDVELHFRKAGLSREQLDRDLATAHEAVAYARALAASTTARVAARATEAAGQARSFTRDWLQKQQERRDRTD
ncbi:MAG TPA: hypothetical protein VMM78_02655 [Thermomicrobiales bacterium]|nr:hypothetical protein [Thermomicrobiales bacterium]